MTTPHHLLCFLFKCKNYCYKRKRFLWIFISPASIGVNSIPAIVSINNVDRNAIFDIFPRLGIQFDKESSVGIDLVNEAIILL